MWNFLNCWCMFIVRCVVDSLLSCITFLFLSQYRYINLVQELHRVNLVALSQDEKLAFFLNLHNAMVIHAVIRVGHPEGVIDRRSFLNEFQYLVGGYPYSLHAIRNGILRNNSRAPYSLTKPFSSGDQRLQVNKLLHNFYLHFYTIKRGGWNCKVANLNQYFKPLNIFFYMIKVLQLFSLYVCICFECRQDF